MSGVHAIASPSGAGGREIECRPGIEPGRNIPQLADHCILSSRSSGNLARDGSSDMIAQHQFQGMRIKVHLVQEVR